MATQSFYTAYAQPVQNAASMPAKSYESNFYADNILEPDFNPTFDLSDLSYEPKLNWMTISSMILGLYLVLAIGGVFAFLQFGNQLAPTQQTIATQQLYKQF